MTWALDAGLSDGQPMRFVGTPALRKRLGQALNDAIRDGALEPDWTDSREIDRLVDAVVEVLEAQP